MESGFQRHYGWDAIRRSLAHFVLGKSFRIVSSLTIYLLLVRGLPLDEYAAYVSFQALIIALGIVTAIGVQKVLFRYLPELRATGNNVAAYRLLRDGMLLRLCVVSLLFIVVLPFASPIAHLFHLGDWTWLFHWYLLMGYLRLTAIWLSQCLESFLWQKESQYSLALGGAVTALSVATLALSGNLHLEFVVIAETAGEAVAVTSLVIGWWRKWRADDLREAGDLGWWRQNRARVLRYGGWSYLLNQIVIFYGSAPNRLVAAHFLPVVDVAVLGAADNLLNLARKLVPTRMFMSMVRPLAMARFAENGDFRAVTALLELTFRFNLMLLTLPIVLLAVVGPELMDWLTRGKYAASGYLLMAFLFVLIAEGSRNLIELTVQALEKNRIFFWTSLIQSGSLLLALPLLSFLGLWSLVVANFVGTVLANSIALIRLHRQGYSFNVNLGLMAWIAFHGLVAGATGWLVWSLSQSLILTLTAIALTYVLSIAVKPPLLEHERKAVGSLIHRRFVKERKERAIAVEPDAVVLERSTEL